jgi:hypothetical protein
MISTFRGKRRENGSKRSSIVTNAITFAINTSTAAINRPTTRLPPTNRAVKRTPRPGRSPLSPRNSTSTMESSAILTLNGKISPLLRNASVDGRSPPLPRRRTPQIRHSLPTLGSIHNPNPSSTRGISAASPKFAVHETPRSRSGRLESQKPLRRRRTLHNPARAIPRRGNRSGTRRSQGDD